MHLDSKGAGDGHFSYINFVLVFYSNKRITSRFVILGFFTEFSPLDDISATAYINSIF